jgi:hypothetical protein
MVDFMRVEGRSSYDMWFLGKQLSLDHILEMIVNAELDPVSSRIIQCMLLDLTVASANRDSLDRCRAPSL